MFKVGDIVKALPKSNEHYSITNHNNRCLAKVVSLDREYMEIEVINTLDGRGISNVYCVYTKVFELNNNNFLKFVEETLNLERK